MSRIGSKGSPATRAAWNRSIIYRAAIHMVDEHGMPVGTAIASAINWARHICDTGDVKQWRGPHAGCSLVAHGVLLRRHPLGNHES